MNILYATDGSDCARTAGRLLASLPLPADARITVLSALPSDEWVESVTLVDIAIREHQLAQRVARQHAEEGAALLSECGVPVTCSIGGGDAAAAILDHAGAEPTDLIVVGSHGKGGMQRLLVGSVSGHVARCAHTSVLVARRESVERVVVGVDGSVSAEHALDALVRLPLAGKIMFTVVYVAPWDEGGESAGWAPSRIGAELDGERPSVKWVPAKFRSMADRIVGEAEQRLRCAGRQAEVRIIWGGGAGEQLIMAARQAKADLVVVGSTNRSGLQRLFLGSVSGYVLNHAQCSVLVARPALIPAIDQMLVPGLVGASVRPCRTSCTDNLMTPWDVDDSGQARLVVPSGHQVITREVC